MPSAILDLDLAGPLAEPVVPAGSDSAHILVRFAGQPVGVARLPVVDGRLLAADLRAQLAKAGGPALRDAWLRQALALTHDGLPPQPLPRCTVAICTRDRPEDLRACLTAVAALPDDGQEVLVVDNAPAGDATRRVLADFPGVRYVEEPRPGLDVARNRALQEAGGEIIAFTDDDARPDPGWLRALARNFADPLVLCVTGLTMPLELETPAQERFERECPFGRGFVRRTFDSTSHFPHQGGPMGAGVNLSLRKSVLPLLGGFDPALDAGTPTRSGGDHELFARILTHGYRIVYDPAALVRHRHRRDWRDLRATLQGYGTGVYAAWTRSLVMERDPSTLLAAWRWFRWDQGPQLVRALFRRPGHRSLSLLLLELWGCALGPWGYLRSRLRRPATP